MNITNIKVELFNLISEPWKVGSKLAFGQTIPGMVTAETGKWVSSNAFPGFSHAGANQFIPRLIEFIKPGILGRDPLDIGKVREELWKLNRWVSTDTIGASDICLWDINCKLAGQPIHRLIGTCKDAVRVYSLSEVMTRAFGIR